MPQPENYNSSPVFTPGTLVYVKLNKTLLWPAKVLEIPRNPANSRKIILFAKDEPPQVISISNIRSFSLEDAKRQLNRGNFRPKKIEDALHQALNEFYNSLLTTLIKYPPSLEQSQGKTMLKRKKENEFIRDSKLDYTLENTPEFHDSAFDLQFQTDANGESAERRIAKKIRTHIVNEKEAKSVDVKSDGGVEGDSNGGERLEKKVL